jgi:catechol 2,3-dioxygenase-like lactoylglutathione lyase family enzyme
MKFHRLDHVGIVVNDLAAAKAFFLDFGFIVKGEWEAEGELLDNVVGLKDVKTAAVMLGLPDGEASIELVKFLTPAAPSGIQPSVVNAFGITHIAFLVDDLDAVVAKMKEKGMEVFSEIQNYENTYKLVFCRGPEGIILDLSEELK